MTQIICLLKFYAFTSMHEIMQTTIIVQNMKMLCSEKKSKLLRQSPISKPTQPASADVYSTLLRFRAQVSRIPKIAVVRKTVQLMYGLLSGSFIIE